MNYFIQLNDVDVGKVKAGFPDSFESGDITEFQLNENGILVQSTDIMDNVFNLLGYTFVSEEQTTYEGVMYAIYSIPTPEETETSAPPEVSVTVGNIFSNGHNIDVRRWHETSMADKDKLIEVINSVLYPVIQDDIILDDVHLGSIGERADKFKINFFTGCLAGNDAVPTLLWDIPTGSDEGGFIFSGRGQGIWDGKFCVAELIDNELYIHYDLLHFMDDPSIEIFRRICTEAVEIMSGNYTWEDNSDKEFLKFMRLKPKENIKHLKGDMDLFKNRALDGIERIKSLQEDITNNNMEVESREGRLKVATEEYKKISPKGIYEQYKDLKTVDGVKSLILEGHTLHIYTEPIVLNKDGKVYDLGRFSITLDLNSGNIYMLCLDKLPEGMNKQAPNLTKEGFIMSSSKLHSVIPELMGTYQFKTVLEMVIAYLREGNGATLSNWEVANV